MKILNEEEARYSVLLYLIKYNSRTKPDETDVIIRALKRIPPFSEIDNSVWDNWQKILSEYRVASKQYYTERDIFETMISLLEWYYKKTASDDIGGLLSDLLHIDYGATADPAAWYDWQDCLTEVKKNSNQSN